MARPLCLWKTKLPDEQGAEEITGTMGWVPRGFEHVVTGSNSDSKDGTNCSG